MTEEIHSVPYSVLAYDVTGSAPRSYLDNNHAFPVYQSQYDNSNLCKVKHRYKNFYSTDIKFKSLAHDYEVITVWRTDNVTCFKCLLVIKAIQRGDI